MDIEDIKQLVQLMVDNDLSELDITDGERKVSLRRGAGNVPVFTALPQAVPAAAPVAPAAAPVAASTAAPVEPAKLLEIKSPMVGTFYAAPSPDSDPYVGVGTAVSDSSVVCIIEAMKVMNEIKAECSGTIMEICVKNAQPVEFGQVLFRVKPS
jgi:acetyl-CoA carboxylase biotin carboxyl carrier protein